MSKLIPTYEERLSNPGLSIINTTYLVQHPESVYELIEKYNYDLTFRTKLDEKMKLDQPLRNLIKSYISNNKIKNGNSK